MDFEDLLENNGFTIVPEWIMRAIDTKAKNMTVSLAHSKSYRFNELDRILGTAPLMQKINVEVN